MKIVHDKGRFCLQEGSQFHRFCSELHRMGMVQIFIRYSEPRTIEWHSEQASEDSPLAGINESSEVSSSAPLINTFVTFEDQCPLRGLPDDFLRALHSTRRRRFPMCLMV